MSLCEILLMALINQEKSIIQGINLPSYHGLDFIRMFPNKSHTQPAILPSCHEKENIWVFCENRSISEKICLLTPILQGGIAFFAIFAATFRFSWQIAQNGKESVVLPDSERSLGFLKKSLIFKNNLSPFNGKVHDHMISEKSHDLSSDLMSSRCIGII